MIYVEVEVENQLLIRYCLLSIFTFDVFFCLIDLLSKNVVGL